MNRIFALFEKNVPSKAKYRQLTHTETIHKNSIEMAKISVEYKFDEFFAVIDLNTKDDECYVLLRLLCH